MTTTTTPVACRGYAEATPDGVYREHSVYRARSAELAEARGEPVGALRPLLGQIVPIS